MTSNNSYKLAHGGMMRCCVQSVQDHFAGLDENATLEVGTRIMCKWCKDGAVVKEDRVIAKLWSEEREGLS